MFLRVLVLVLCLVPSLASVGAANLVTNGGFETAGSTSSGAFLPTTAGVWDGDITSIVTTESGIVPYDGTRMLHFINTAPTGPSPAGSSECIQSIDLTPHAALIASGAMVVFRFKVNRVAGGPQTDRLFAAYIEAHSGSPANLPSTWASSPLASSSATLVSDSDPSTWEQVTCALRLPPATTYVAIDLGANEDVVNNTGNPELDGHYADDVSVEIVPRAPATSPASMMLMAALLLVPGVCLLRRA